MYRYTIVKFSKRKKKWIEIASYRNEKLAKERYELYKKNTNEPVVIQIAFLV